MNADSAAPVQRPNRKAVRRYNGLDASSTACTRTKRKFGQVRRWSQPVVW